MGKLKGYDRKEYLRHRTTKQQRFVNSGIDSVVKGVSSTGRGLDRLSAQVPNTPENQMSLPTSITLTGTIIGFLVFLVTVKHFGIIVAFSLGVVSFLFSLFVLSVSYGSMKGRKKRRDKAESKDSDMSTADTYYHPNPEWMGEMVEIDSRASAQILAPQLLKQAQECAKILATTTEPATFFMRYDFCVGRLMELEECKKRGASISAISDLSKYLSLAFREEAVNEIICRTWEKYQAKIDSLKTPKAKQNWAIKYHDAFEPYLPYMSDEAKTKLSECSVDLRVLAGMNEE